MRNRHLVIGLGSNLGSRIVNLRTALSYIKKQNHLWTVVDAASIYESDALVDEAAPPDWQKKFLNSAVLLRCSVDLHPLEILTQIKKLEAQMGRQIKARWAPRAIDLDILWMEGVEYADEKLSIPHRDILKRPFALMPLLQLKPDLRQEWKEKLPSWTHLWRSERPFNTIISTNFFWSETVGILNVTPDSFSESAGEINPLIIENKILKMLHEQVDIIDIGAESTRPGAQAVTPDEEIRRLKSGLKIIVDHRHPESRFKISIDSRHPQVIRELLSSGFEVDFINDVSGLVDYEMQKIAIETGLPFFVMHSLAVPPQADFVVDQESDPCEILCDWWNNKKETLLSKGLSEDQLIFDPGIGFGKTKEQNIYILRNLRMFGQITEPILIGHSRKSYQTLYSNREASQRDAETALDTYKLNRAFAQFIRVHDIETHKMALRNRDLT